LDCGGLTPPWVRPWRGVVQWPDLINLAFDPCDLPPRRPPPDWAKAASSRRSPRRAARKCPNSRRGQDARATAGETPALRLLPPAVLTLSRPLRTVPLAVCESKRRSVPKAPSVTSDRIIAVISKWRAAEFLGGEEEGSIRLYPRLPCGGLELGRPPLDGSSLRLYPSKTGPNLGICGINHGARGRARR